MNEEQAKAASAPIDQPLLITAGPGSGKTYTLINRILAILTYTDSIAGILVLTFSSQAANEMTSRLLLQDIPSDNVLVHTYHSFAWKLVKQYWKNLQYISPPSICTNKIFVDTVKNLISKEFSKDFGHCIDGKPESNQMLYRLCKLLLRAKSTTDPISFLAGCRMDSKLPQLFSKMQDRLRQLGVLQFAGDMWLL